MIGRLCLLLVLAGCGRIRYDALEDGGAPSLDAPELEPADAAPVDAAPPDADAAPPDAPSFDAAPADAAPADAAPPDAAPPDAAPPDADAAPPDASACAAPYVLSTYGCHHFVSGGATWYQAETACEAEGAHLVVVGSSAEGNYVLLTQLENHWVGATDQAVEGSFRWITDEAAGLAFASGQPDNSGGVEDCVERRFDGLNDLPCTQNKSYVCERDSRPVAPGAVCDTDSSASCGSCGVVCGGTTSCVAQICQ